jgi:DNA mismatch repair protein MutS
MALYLTIIAKLALDDIYREEQDLITISHLIKSLQSLQIILENNPKLKELMKPEYSKLTELFDANSTNSSNDLKELIANLLSSSFIGTGSYFFSSQGKIAATHYILTCVKGELIPYLEAFGQIDAYLATVKLYEQFKDHENAKFCFPEYIIHETPIFMAESFWHPLIDAHKVVCNDLSMGNQNTHANLILTGPNAGGKTTSLTALISNIIFAQTLGIAPSTTLYITPFAKIHSSLDVTTNLQAGLSLFAAEVDRAKKLKTSIESCTPGQKTFTIVDELFTGTAETIAANIGLKFATILGNMKHSMMIITTHIKHLTKLETETDCFTNYKVADAIIDEAGKITYPFKLVKGISDQNIAEQMMQQEGIL